MMPARALDTPTKRKILRVMAEEPRMLTTEDLAASCNRSQSSVSRALADLTTYSFVDEERIEGSKERVYGFDAESRYTGPILDFFEVERELERRNRTVPVSVWNVLEDVADAMESKVDNFVGLFLFGSYATGNYYSGSDVDLFLLVEPPESVGKRQSQQVIDEMAPKREVQLVVGAAERPGEGWDDDTVTEVAKARAPVDAGDPLLALHVDFR